MIYKTLVVYQFEYKLFYIESALYIWIIRGHVHRVCYLLITFDVRIQPV